jgi:hypothetical protein
MNMVNFTADLDTCMVIEKIVTRAGYNGQSRMTLSMDLDAANSNGCPMDFEKLFSFDDFNFWHDIHGIQRNINRTTGKVENCFSPRCSK